MGLFLRRGARGAGKGREARGNPLPLPGICQTLPEQLEGQLVGHRHTDSPSARQDSGCDEQPTPARLVLRAPGSFLTRPPRAVSAAVSWSLPGQPHSFRRFVTSAVVVIVAFDGLLLLGTTF